MVIRAVEHMIEVTQRMFICANSDDKAYNR